MATKRPYDWLPVQAVVSDCLPSWFRTGEGESGMPGEYVVSFTYKVRGTTFQGWYSAGSFHESGKTIHILYDPLHPEKNTGSENQASTRSRIIASIVGASLTVFLIWLSQRSW